MKKPLLILSITFFLASFAFAQSAASFADCEDCPKNIPVEQIDLTVYPNPAIDFINFNNTQDVVNQVVLYNLVGHPLKRFSTTGGKNSYNVSDLSRGMYLVQLVDASGNVLTTKRLNKR